MVESRTSAAGDFEDQALLLKASVLISQGKDQEARQTLSAVSDNYRELAKTMLASTGKGPAAKATVHQ